MQFYSYFKIFNLQFLGAWIKITNDVSVFCVCLVTQSCPTLWDPKDCSPPGSSVHGILQARILECIVIPFSRGSSQPSNWTWVSRTAGRFFTIWATREVHLYLKTLLNLLDPVAFYFFFLNSWHFLHRQSWYLKILKKFYFFFPIL